MIDEEINKAISKLDIPDLHKKGLAAEKVTIQRLRKELADSVARATQHQQILKVLNVHFDEVVPMDTATKTKEGKRIFITPLLKKEVLMHSKLKKAEFSLDDVSKIFPGYARAKLNSSIQQLTKKGVSCRDGKNRAWSNGMDLKTYKVNPSFNEEASTAA